MKNKSIHLLAVLALISCACVSCNDYLDIVPDKVSTLDNAFVDRHEAEKYLITCYSYIPDNHLLSSNVGLMGADEIWAHYPNGDSRDPWMIARGNQNSNDPYCNGWDGSRGSKAFYKAIRDCNIFLENVSDLSKVKDLTATQRKRWLSEVTFLKAYYHFQLFRMYGPVVIADKALPVDAAQSEYHQKRSTVDEVVKYISDLLDTCLDGLPQDITNKTEELGRITKPIALSLKARLWVTAASPLFNGNPDYRDFVDKEGTHLFNANTEEQQKVVWDSAAVYCRRAIESCELNNMSLYRFENSAYSYMELSDETKTQMSIRNSFAEDDVNPELIWGLTGRRANDIQGDCMARIDPDHLSNMWAARELVAPTLGITNYYYTANGVPLTEDKEWDYSGRNEIQEATHDDRFKLAEGHQTVKLHFAREPRFYANLAFDGSVWYMQNSRSGSDENTFTVKARPGYPQAKYGADNYSETGYWVKKLVNWRFVLSDNSSTTRPYAWPEFRLADLYLLYAEALNESGKTEESIVWVDKVRERAGLRGVKESWDRYSNKPDKYKTVSGMREIIHHERTIELMFEGSRFWDLRRWKEAETALNKRIYGWNTDMDDVNAYYHQRFIFEQQFIAPRDYLFPLKTDMLLRNKALVQNPGW